MKSYFTKYLPVEGEIKEGDMIICNGIMDKVVEYPFKGNDHYLYGYDILLEKEGTQTRKLLGKPYKLFLCSRDIQVGDTVVSQSGNKQIVTNKGGHPHWSGHAYKVIGEISPDALSYVKEEDEFDESQLQFVIWENPYFDIPYSEEVVQYPEWAQTILTETMGKTIRIKGPCGHFH